MCRFYVDQITRFLVFHASWKLRFGMGTRIQSYIKNMVSGMREREGGRERERNKGRERKKRKRERGKSERGRVSERQKERKSEKIMR